MEISGRRAIKIFILVLTIVVSYLLFILIKGYLDGTNENVMPVAACGSKEGIFMIGNTFDDRSGVLLSSGIYTLDKGELSLYYNMKVTDSMSYKKIALDKDNHLFLMVRKQEEVATYEIWEMNHGTILNKFDISSTIDETNNGGIQAFTVDGNGKFYVREIASDEVIVIDPVRSDILRIKDISSNISFESMATGRDGEVYVLFSKHADAGGGFMIFSLAGGRINEICDGNILPMDEIYSVMGTSTKYDLVMKGIYGVYGYHFDSNTSEHIADLPPYESEFTKSFMVEDELYIFFTDMDDDNRYKIKSVELQLIDLISGALR